jgi:hypothetical protein
MTSNFWLLFGSAIALFLAGCNLAFLVTLGGTLVMWFKFKVFAMMLTLTYVCMSFAYGAPTGPRVGVGWAALLVDVLAVFWMWYSVNRARERGDIGLVPIVRSRGPKGDKNDPS